MTLSEVMQELEAMGNEQTKKTLTKHGAREPFFGVKVGDMKKIVKKIKKNHELSLALYQTGNSDAMYLAGLIADEGQISKNQLINWAEKAYWYMISEYTVAWVAAESKHGWELATEWIKSNKENIASTGWATLSSIISIQANEDLDMNKLLVLLERVLEKIQFAKNRERYTMNGFVIAMGSFVPELTDKAIEIAKKMGKVNVEMGGTACKVPVAPQYIEKVITMGRQGKKRKQARC